VPPTPKSLGFHVKEAVAFDTESAAAIAVFLRDRARLLFLPELEIHQRPDTYFVEFLCDFGGQQFTRIYSEGEGQAMLRLVLLREFFEDVREELQRRLDRPPGTPGSLEITFKTDIGQASLQVSRGSIRVRPRPGKGAVVIKTPQNALTRLVVGYWSLDRFLRRANVKRLPDKARNLLTTLFPPTTPYTAEPDYF
jgi:hypothetical protein